MPFASKEKAREYRINRYQNDPEFRAKVAENNKRRYEQVKQYKAFIKQMQSQLTVLNDVKV